MELLDYNKLVTDELPTPIRNQYEELELLWNEQLIPAIKRQIFELSDHGFNYIADIQQLDLEFFTEIVEYIDSTYLNIPQLDDILSNELKLNLFSRYIYEFFAVEGLTILDDVAQSNNLTIYQLAYLSPIDIKHYILSYLMEHVSMMQTVKRDLELNADYNKYLFYIDMFDNDLDKFVQNWFRPILDNRYVT